MVKTPKQANSPLQITEKMGFLKSYSFFWDYILEKENTHIPSRLLDSSFLNWDYIPEQRKSTRYSTTTRYYNSSTSFYLTLQTTRACMHIAWISWSL